MSRTLVLAATLFTSSAWIAPEALACSASDAAAASAGEIPAKATVAEFTVTGMTCGSCALQIRTAIEAIEGVTVAQVHMDGTLKVAYDQKQTNIDAIVDAVVKLEKYTIQRA